MKGIATELRAIGVRRDVPYYRSVEEKLEHVASGRGVIVLPLSSTATFFTRPDVTHVGIDDIPPKPGRPGLGQLSTQSARRRVRDHCDVPNSWSAPEPTLRLSRLGVPLEFCGPCSASNPVE